MRARPWRSRGPWFDNRAGARRRGRRADELVAAVSNDLQVQDDGATAGVDVVEVEDVLLSGAPVWPIPERMPAALVAFERASTSVANGPDPVQALQPIDQLVDVFTAHMLSSQSDDSADSSSSTRQSA